MDILIIEDNDSLAANIGEYLVQQGDTPDFAADGQKSLALCRAHDYDAIILDLGLPDIDGIDVCTRLRHTQDEHTPLLMLTARDTVEDRIAGLEAGSDDYLTKPFSLRELHLRLQAIARRREDNANALCVGTIRMDPATRLVHLDNEPVELSPIGFNILRILMESYPGVVTRQRIERVIWHDEPPDSQAALRGHILRLRRNLATPNVPVPIKTIHGVGYQLIDNESTS